VGELNIKPTESEFRGFYERLKRNNTYFFFAVFFLEAFFFVQQQLFIGNLLS